MVECTSLENWRPRKRSVGSNPTTSANNNRGRKIPIYEYKCTACGKTCEKLQKFSDGPPQECPECGEKGTLEKTLSAGTGFFTQGPWLASEQIECC